MAFIRPGLALTISCFTDFGLAWASAQRRWACRLRLDGRTFAWDLFRFFLLSVLFMTSVEMNAELPVTEGYMTPPLTMARAFGKSLNGNKVFLRRKCSGVDWLKSITMKLWGLSPVTVLYASVRKPPAPGKTCLSRWVTWKASRGFLNSTMWVAFKLMVRCEGVRSNMFCTRYITEVSMWWDFLVNQASISSEWEDWRSSTISRVPGFVLRSFGGPPLMNWTEQGVESLILS